VGTEKRERQKANRALKQQQMEQAASRRKTTRRIAVGVAAVAGVFLVAWIASNFVADDEPTPTPTVPELTVPDVSLPDVSLPDVTLPDVTVPAAEPTATTGG
jgi:ferric-dicitrate binding protein FerR (iron transport regulator)